MTGGGNMRTMPAELRLQKFPVACGKRSHDHTRLLVTPWTPIFPRPVTTRC